MNLAEVLNVALPELPARKTGKEPPRLNPKLVAREQIEGGIPTVVAMISGDPSVIRFTPETWKLVELFDGQNSYRDIAELYQQQTGAALSDEQVREFAAELEESGLFYKKVLDLNVTASQKLADQRQRRVKRKVDLAALTVSAWDPDAYLSRLHEAVGFLYTKWFTLFTLGVFSIMAAVFVSGWHEIWRDTVRYYDFTDKSAWDLAEFWLLFCGLGFFHESAHGLTCKHFGGGVHRMGFMLIYLSPAFFVDIGEVYVFGGKWQRAAAIIAGIWVELMFCSAASIVWWGTPAGSPVHDFAYKIMLITGVAVVLLNLNPLIKLDGYYLFGELVGIPTLKENSTEYLSAWVKRRVFRLPVEIPYHSRRRRWLFAVYGVTSGLYSYLVLFVVVHLTYNIFFRFSPTWAFLPALIVALLILRSRLRSSVRFMKDFYLDKRQSLRAWWNVPRKAVLAGLIVFALIPMWRETVMSRFVLEPVQRAVIRAAVPGQVVDVMTDEGARVGAGAPLVRLRSLSLEEDKGQSFVDLSVAEASSRQAQLNYAGLGPALNERAADVQRYQSVARQIAELKISSPIVGLVVTPRIRDLVGSFVEAGTELAEVDNVDRLRARIFVPEFQFRRVVPGAAVSLKLESSFQPIRGVVESLAPVSSQIAVGLVEEEKYKGIAPPGYYVANVLVSNSSGILRPGMSGDAKILVGTHSFAGQVWQVVREFVQRKLW
jgi:putative peptide zinc metalloprotease protein